MKTKANLIRIAFFIVFAVVLALGKPVLWLVFFAASLVGALFFGRLYCGYACPMNTLMIPADWLGQKLKIQKQNTPSLLAKGWLPMAALALSLAAMLIGKRLLNRNLPVLPLWVLLSVLVTLRYKPEVFHNLICPFGALQRFFGRFTCRSKQVDAAACIGCRKCEKVCPSAAIRVEASSKKALITPALCHQCTNCQAVCPTDAIHYTATALSVEH